MKAKRLLFLVMAICLVSGVRAQFYDSADDIYYYVELENGNYKESCKILNFDGTKACLLNEYIEDGNHYIYSVDEVKNLVKRNTNYFEEQVEVGDYSLKYISGNTYSQTVTNTLNNYMGTKVLTIKYTLRFSSDRNYLFLSQSVDGKTRDWTYKRVDKSYFKSGRSRTPSGTMHE